MTEPVDTAIVGPHTNCACSHAHIYNKWTPASHGALGKYAEPPDVPLVQQLCEEKLWG